MFHPIHLLPSIFDPNQTMTNFLMKNLRLFPHYHQIPIRLMESATVQLPLLLQEFRQSMEGVLLVKNLQITRQ